MKIIGRGLVIAMSILAASTFATDFGRVRLPGDATVKHDGDYVVYSINFDSSCYTEEQDAITEVSNGVAGFASWLDNLILDFNSGTVEYWADLQTTSRDSNRYVYHYYGDDNRIENPCYEKYSTHQSLSVRVTKLDDVVAISRGVVQGIYDQLFRFLWPYNHRGIEAHSWASAKVTGVEKGVNDETLERMKERAYANARSVATARFLATLGGDYVGQWYFANADFTDERYISYRHKSLASDAAIMPPAAGPVGPIPEPPISQTVINLEPLEYSVDGVFEFGFSRDYNDVTP